MQIIPLVASQVNLTGLCGFVGDVPSLTSKTDYGKAAEILSLLGAKELSLRLTIGVRTSKDVVEAVRDLERFKVTYIINDCWVVESDFNVWRAFSLTETIRGKFLREFFCHVFVYLEMIFPELVMDLIRVTDSDGKLFSLNKRY